jgi:nucleoside-diphosphate-sugar epimerase
MKVLFIGGTGIISTAVSHVAIDRGMDLYVLNRGHHNDVLPEGVTTLVGDIYNEEEIHNLLEGHTFDAIVQWISFTVEHVARDVRLFKPYTKQYVFISSASAYVKPFPFLPITEEVPLDNQYWTYSKNKQKCEEFLLQQQTDDFHVTIIRPSHTYNTKMIISQLSSHSHPFTMIDRVKQGQPVVLPDGGKELWTITYNYDFAEAFLDVLGNTETYGEYYHLTGDKAYTWEAIYQALADALNAPYNTVSIPWDFIFQYFPEFKPEILGDKQKSTYFDNSKIKAVAPHYVSKTEYHDVIKQTVADYLADPLLQAVDTAFNKRYDQMISDWNSNKM